MKQLELRKVVWLVLLCASAAANAQVNILGKWNVSCAIEKTETGVTYCPICPVVYENDSTSLAIQSFSMMIKKDSIIFTTNKEALVVPYTSEMSTDKLVLTYKKRTYKLAILTLDENSMLLLKDEFGNILHLIRSY